MNNEPVAWMNRLGILEYEQGNGFEIPLYTHPAKPFICVGYWDNKTGAFHKNLTELQQKRVTDGFLQAVYTKGMYPAKTLTDEEITEIYNKVYEEGHDNQVIALARAILKKASEK